MQKYRFAVQPLRAPVGLLVEGDRLAGLRFQHTRVEQGRAVPIPGETEDVRAPLVVSSIGSIPEPMQGIDQESGLYRWADRDLGRLAGYETVFSTGNVVTGKGNILDSRRHSVHVTTHLVEHFLGLDGQGHGDEGVLLDAATATAAETAGRMAGWVKGRPSLHPVDVERLLARVRARQREVGYAGDYRTWIARVTPPDLV
jgi:hypothetical protein